MSFRELLTPGRLFPGLLLVFVLMLVNWSLEAIKWKTLVTNLETVSFKNALTAIFTGLTVSFFTPNRVGEFLGRVFILKNSDRVESSVLTIVGSITQFIVTLVMGSLALLLFLNRFTSLFLSINIIYTIGIIISWFCFAVLLLFGLYHITVLGYFGQNRGVSGWKLKLYESMKVLLKVSPKVLTTLLALSFGRFLVFTFQAYLLLKLMNISITILDSFVIISLVFFILAAIPTVAMSELGVRGSVAVFLFGFYERSLGGYFSGTLDIQVIVSFSLLWVINIAIPAFIGSFMLFRLQFFRNEMT